MANYKIGQIVEHTAFGQGTIFNICEKDEKINLTVKFEAGEKILDPAIAPLEIIGEDENIKLKELFREVLHEEIGENLGEQISEAVKQTLQQHQGDLPIQLGERWIGGEIIIKPGRGDLKDKVVPIETFFHKIVMVRDRLRVLEQNINSSKKLDDEDKINLQQYITRCYGSLTTFNVLFAHREDWFVGESSKK